MNDQRKRQAEAKQDEHFPVAWPHNGEPTSKKEVETRIAEAVKRERARILDVARNWTGCKYCSTGETLKELVHPAPSNEGEGA